MAKLTKASEEIEKLVNDVANELGLAQIGLEFQPLNTRKAKEVVKVMKANEVTELMSKRQDLVIVIVYEAAFDLVDDKTRYMWMRMAMEQVSYNCERGKVIIGCPTITVPLGFADKYGEAAINAAKLGIHTIAQIEDMERERKEAAKANKKKKNENQ